MGWLIDVSVIVSAVIVVDCVAIAFLCPMSSLIATDLYAWSKCRRRRGLERRQLRREMRMIHAAAELSSADFTEWDPEFQGESDG